VNFIPALRDDYAGLILTRQLQVADGDSLVLVRHRALLDGVQLVQPVKGLRHLAVAGFGHRLPVFLDPFLFLDGLRQGSTAPCWRVSPDRITRA
jgi:hypothetical protein